MPPEVPRLVGAAYPSATMEEVWVRARAPDPPQNVCKLPHAVDSQTLGPRVALAGGAEKEHSYGSAIEGCPMPTKKSRGVFCGWEDSALLVDGPRMGGAGQNRRVIIPSPCVAKKQSPLREQGQFLVEGRSAPVSCAAHLPSFQPRPVGRRVRVSGSILNHNDEKSVLSGRLKGREKPGKTPLRVLVHYSEARACPWWSCNSLAERRVCATPPQPTTPFVSQDSRGKFENIRSRNGGRQDLLPQSELVPKPSS